MRVSGSRTNKRGTYKPTTGRHTQVGSKRPTFAETLSVASHTETRIEVDADLEWVDDAARRFSESPTPKNLAAFKEAAKAVLTKVLQNAYAVEQTRSFGRHGRQRIQVLIRVVDDHLDQLARLILEKSHDTMSIKHHIEEIKGLLFDALR